MRFIIILIYLLAGPASYAQPPEACSCLWQGSFSRITDHADLIVSGVVISNKGNSLDFSISQTLIDRKTNGEEFQPEIRIWGANGKECRPPITHFPIDSTWVMALKKITTDIPGGFNPNTPNISYGRINDYYLSSCGAYWLHVHEDSSSSYVTGNLTNKNRWQWQDEAMNPVLIDLIEAYIHGTIPENVLVKAAKPTSHVKELMQKTKQFLNDQQ